jgi:hypothetical protein
MNRRENLPFRRRESQLLDDAKRACFDRDTKRLEVEPGQFVDPCVKRRGPRVFGESFRAGFERAAPLTGKEERDAELQVWPVAGDDRLAGSKSVGVSHPIGGSDEFWPYSVYW